MASTGQNFANYVATEPDQLDWLQRGVDKINYGQQPVGEGFQRTMVGLGNQLGAFGASGIPLGLATLNQILAGQGKTDPALLNRSVSANAQNTGAQQLMFGQDAARRGMQNSGVTQAINAAIGSAGANREAGIYAADAAQTEQRKRDDIMLMLDTLIKPSIDTSAISTGQYASSQESNDRKKAATTAAIAAILSAIACWVARSIYGADDPRWLVARYYVLNMAPAWFRRAYLEHGEKFAGWLDNHAWAKPIVKPIFDYMLWRVASSRVVA